MTIESCPWLEKKSDYPSGELSPEVMAAYSNHIFDISYSMKRPELKLDLWFPNIRSEKHEPLLVFFHGGAFSSCTKRTNNLECFLYALNAGYAVAAVEYRKSFEAHFPAMVYDAKTAIRFLRANSQKYCLDANRIAAVGQSSGAWLAAMIGLTSGNPAFEDLELGYSEYSSSVQAVVDVSGPCSGFDKMDKQLGCEDNHDSVDSPESRFLGIPITCAPELVRLAAPITYVGKQMPPMLIIHGEKDGVVPVQQSTLLYDTVMEFGNRNSQLEIIKDVGHCNEPWAVSKSVANTVIDFLNTAL